MKATRKAISIKWTDVRFSGIKIIKIGFPIMPEPSPYFSQQDQSEYFNSRMDVVATLAEANLEIAIESRDIDQTLALNGSNILFRLFAVLNSTNIKGY
ncbi:MAG: hypothetical protein WDN00_05190 [Limisphaerales bacterium]